MFYEPPKDDHGLPYNPFKALVAPRPIGWITTMSLKGEVNLSPYSYFNAVSDRPGHRRVLVARPQGRPRLCGGDRRVRLQSRDLRPARGHEPDLGAAAAGRERARLRRPDAGALPPRQAAARRRVAGGARVQMAEDRAARAPRRPGAIPSRHRRGGRYPHRRP